MALLLEHRDARIFFGRQRVHFNNVVLCRMNRLVSIFCLQRVARITTPDDRREQIGQHDLHLFCNPLPIL